MIPIMIPDPSTDDYDLIKVVEFSIPDFCLQTLTFLVIIQVLSVSADRHEIYAMKEAEKQDRSTTDNQSESEHTVTVFGRDPSNPELFDLEQQRQQSLESQMNRLGSKNTLFSSLLPGQDRNNDSSK